MTIWQQQKHCLQNKKLERTTGVTMEFIDYFGKDASCLKNKKLWLFDIDGTIYEEDRLFDGTLALLTNIEKIDGALCIHYK